MACCSSYIVFVLYLIQSQSNGNKLDSINQGVKFSQDQSSHHHFTTVDFTNKRKLLTTVTVSSADELASVIASDTIIEIGADILNMTSTVSISGITNLVFNGNGHQIISTNQFECFSISASSTVTFNNLTISNCRAIRSIGTSIVVITGCTIHNNTNSALSLSYSSLTLLNSNISHNVGVTGGGVGSSSSTLLINNTQFAYNSATGNGGGIGLSGAYPYELNDCLFIGNTASTSGAAISIANSATGVLNRIQAFYGFLETASGQRGAGVYVGDSDVMIRDSEFAHNGRSGGGSNGGALAITGGSTGVIVNTIVNDNKAKYGGGLYVTSSVVTIDKTQFRNNKGNIGAGIFLTSRSTITLTNTIITNASAYSGSTCSGCGIYSDSSIVATLDNVIIANNAHATTGGAISARGASTYSSELYISNSQFSNCSASTSYGGGLYMTSYVDTWMSNVAISNMKALGGGGVSTDSTSELVMNNSVFISNAASSQGAAIYAQNTVTATECSFFDHLTSRNTIYTTGTFIGKKLTFKDSNIDFAGTSAPSATCESGCQIGEFGNCTLASGTTSCFINCPCDACLAGSFGAKVNSVADHCTNCSAGEYQPDEGQTFCLTCPNGTDSPFGSDECFAPTQVPTISLIPSSVPTLVTNYPSYIPTPSPSSLPTPLPSLSPSSVPTIVPTPVPSPLPTIHCAQGYYLEDNTCYPCSAGSYSSVIGPPFPDNCTKCAVGTYQPTPGSTSCLYCVLGKYSNDGRTECVACPSGTYVYDYSKCIDCPLGQYAASAQVHSCTSCGAGFKTNKNVSATTCTACDTGSYSEGSTDVCLSCSQGKYSGNAATVCIDCDKGFYSSRAGESSCLACEAGYYASQSSAVNCTACEVGKYQGATGQSSCDDCEAAKYASEKATTSCSSCDQGSSSDIGSASCDLANVDYYITSLYDRTVQNCPSNSACLGRTFAPIPDEGYWVDRTNVHYLGILYPCSRRTCTTDDDNSQTKNSTNCWDIKNYNKSECLSHELQCSKGAKGPLCGSCKDGYTYRGCTNKCEKCQSTQLTSLYFIIILMILFLCFIGVKYSDQGKKFLKYTQFLESGSLKLDFNGQINITQGVFRHLSNHCICWFEFGYQGHSHRSNSILFGYGVLFPEPFNQMLSFLTIFSLDLFALECFNEGDDAYFITVYLWCTIPIFIALLIICVYFCRIIILNYQRTNHINKMNKTNLGYISSEDDIFHSSHMNDNDTVGSSVAQIRSQHMWGLLFLSYLILPPVSSIQLRNFDCIRLENGEKYLRSDTSIDCHSVAYVQFSYIIIMFIILYQLIPLIWMYLLYQQRDALSIPKGKEEDLIIAERNEIESLCSLKFLFIDYKCNKWWFEVIEMYRRILFIGVLPLVSLNSSIRSSFGLLLAFISIAVIREVKPYRVEFTNVIANVAQFSIALTFYAVLSIDAGGMITFGQGDFGSGLFLVAVNSVVVSLVLGLGILRFRESLDTSHWRQGLTTQQLELVNRIMDDSEGSLLLSLNSRLSQEEEERNKDKDDDEKEIEMKSTMFLEKVNRTKRSNTNGMILKQFILHPKDVIMTKKVGAGAFGEVFKGTCMGEPVAIKTMIDVTEANVKEFKNEIILTATLRHPNIVNFVGACWGKELMCLVLEWVAKGSLRDLLETKDLRWDDPLLKLAIDIARGMNYLHNRKYFDERDGEMKECILHRDLKPDNALISNFTAAKLADFGTSRAKGEEDVTMTAVGTPLYVAPEIARGELYDEKVDVYSFGLTLLEMSVEESILKFIGERWVVAFDKKKIPKQPMRLIRPMTEDGWRPVTDENPISFAPPTINSLIVRCCSHDPTQRPSFADILNELWDTCKKEIDSKIYDRRPQVMYKHRAATVVGDSRHRKQTMDVRNSFPTKMLVTNTEL